VTFKMFICIHFKVGNLAAVAVLNVVKADF
jgi:hypothetical protein